MPKSTATGIYISLFALLAGFGFVWEIIWLIVVSTIGIIVVFIAKGFNEHSEYVIPATEVAKLEAKRAEQIAIAKVEARSDAEDMGLIEFITTAPGWLLGQMRNK